MLKKFLIGTFVALALLVGVTASAAYDFGPTTLKVGSSGQYVMNVQTVVGAMPVDGLFGPMTKAAVMAWQATNGLVADGLVGPATKNAMNAGSYTGGTTSTVPGCTPGALFSSTTGQSCTSTSTYPAGCTSTVGYSSTTGMKCDGSQGGTTPTPGPLAGNYGTIASMTQLSQYNNEEVGAGQSDIKVAGADVKASKDGDIELTAMKIYFDATGYATGDSTRIEDYLDSVSILMGSTVVGSADMSDFARSSTGIYSKTIPLTGAIVRSDDTESFYITVDAVSNLDSGDIDSDSWTVAIENVRYLDGSGVTTTDSGIIPANMDYDTAGNGVGISFVSYSSASNTEFKITESSSNPAAQIVEASTTANTDDVLLLKGTIKIEGTSDVWLDAVPVLFTATGATNADDIAGTVYLTIGDKTYSESMGTDAGTPVTIVFDNLDMWLDAGETVNFEVTADVNDISGDFDAGDTLKADLGETQTDLTTFSAENEGGDALADGEKTGTVAGNAQAFRSTGMQIALVSAPTPVKTAGDPSATTPTSDEADYSITFDVTAFGSDIYLDKTAPDETGTSTSAVSDNGAGTFTATITSANTLTGTNGYKVVEGTTERFTISGHTLATTSGYFYLSITDLMYALTDIDGDLTYNFDMGAFKTPQVYLTDR